jgi:hypothetical protein
MSDPIKCGFCGLLSQDPQLEACPKCGEPLPRRVSISPAPTPSFTSPSIYLTAIEINENDENDDNAEALNRWKRAKIIKLENSDDPKTLYLIDRIGEEISFEYCGHYYDVKVRKVFQRDGYPSTYITGFVTEYDDQKITKEDEEDGFERTRTFNIEKMSIIGRRFTNDPPASAAQGCASQAAKCLLAIIIIICIFSY